MRKSMHDKTEGGERKRGNGNSLGLYQTPTSDTCQLQIRLWKSARGVFSHILGHIYNNVPY